MEILSFARFGYEGEIIKVEADLRRGLPAIDIVGLPDGAVREARERMRAAIRNSGLEFPRDRILINLSPADLKKEGSSFDLPIALAVLSSASGEQAAGGTERVMVLGELELSGTVRPVRGVLAAVSRGLREGISRYIVPVENAAEAGIREEADVIAVGTLTEAVHRLHALSSAAEGEGAIQAAPPSGRGTGGGMVRKRKNKMPVWSGDGPDFGEVRGQAQLVRALEIAAAGGHSLIAYGPPGCGKTLALGRFQGLLPDLEDETAVTATRIHSLAGLSCTSGVPGAQHAAPGSSEGILLRRPPFRTPHPSASLEGIAGGGRNGTPGEISLAHGGALFLDETALFGTAVLQALRSPLETGTVTVSRAGRSDTFPARFQLLLAVNPCPCGNFGTPGRVCTCTPEMIGRYWKRLTAPLLDRIDLRIAVRPPDPEALTGTPLFSTAELRAEIGRARATQRERNPVGKGEDPAWQNAWLGPDAIGAVCALGDGEKKLFSRGMEAAGLSGRGGHGVLRTARTIADLGGAERIGEDHLLEAIQLRRWSAGLPDFM